MLAQTHQSPHASGCPVKGGMSPCRSQGERNSPSGIFLFVSFFFLCLFWQKEKADLRLGCLYFYRVTAVL